MPKNEIIIRNDFAEIVIRNRNKDIVNISFIDLDDVEKVIGYSWSYNSVNGYIQNTRAYHEGKGRYLHQFILGKRDGFDIDHINENKVDNRKINLRYVSRSYNKLNVKKSKGVTWDKNRNKWMAYIKVDGKSHFLGRFDIYEDALSARLIAKEKLVIFA